MAGTMAGGRVGAGQRAGQGAGQGVGKSTKHWSAKGTPQNTAVNHQHECVLTVTVLTIAGLHSSNNCRIAQF